MTKNYTAEDILQALSTYYKESIFVSDGEGNVIFFVNDIGAERIGAKNKEEILYRNVKELVKDGYYDNSPILKAIETKKETFATIRYKNENASVSHSVPVLDDNRNVTMVVTNNMSTEHSNEWANILSKEHANMEKLRRELDYLRLQDHGTMIVNSPKMKNVIQTVNAIAPTDSNVVILGESGTGKDMMARYIHERSNRSREAFISINCAALPEQLLESELFGYEAGAFTGALSKGKIGLFEAASGGTIFLDEIGDMPLSLQSKLSRSFFADSSIHALRFLSLLLRLLSFDFSLCILLAQAGQYFDIPELGTYSTPHTVQFLGFNAVHRFVGVICNSPTKPMNL